MSWPFTPSLRTRLSVYISAPILVICVFMYAFFPDRQWRQATAALAERTRSVAAMAAFTAGPALTFEDPISAREALQAVARVPDLAYVVIFDMQGDLFGAHDPLRLWPADDGPTAAMAGLRDDVYQVIVPVVHDGEQVGWMQVGLTLTGLREEAAQSGRTIALITLLLLAAGFTVSLVVSRRLTRPLSQMVETFERISGGDLSPRAPVHGADEVGQLARAFNSMVDSLASSQRALRRAHEELESRVEERTHELRQANDSLQHEVRERQEAEEARSAAEGELETQRLLRVQSDRLRSLGEMAAGIAHELNQPLMGVRGLAEHILIARDRGWQEAEERLFERVAGIVEQADRMVHIIEHVRLFAREAGKPEMSRVDVNDVVGSASGLVSSQLNSRGIDVLFELTRPLPKVRANPYSLEEVLINILSNARDALADTPESGPARTIRILTGERVRRGDQEVTIDIIDTGHGIATDVLARVLEPFYTTKEPGAGTGLGLSVSHSIVEQFGGRLEIESTVGVGTTVRVSLPVAT